MIRTATLLIVSAIISLAIAVASAQGPAWPPPKAPAIAEADGYVAIPGAAVAPNRATTYRVVIDGTKSASRPGAILPALNTAGSILNDLAVAGVPLANAKIAVVIHGAALDGILNEPSYRTKFGAANPNLPVLSALKKAGVALFVCGQNLAADHVDPKTLSSEVTVASDAFLVLITYQDRGYALMTF